MARARKAASTNSSNESTAANTFTCPECGKTFTRAASLGAHRNRAHGIAGASSSARGTRRRSGSSNGGSARRRGAGRSASQRTRSTARRAGSTTGGDGAAVNRDQLLQTLFPSGLPAREEVIRRANAWLDEAERLAKSK